MCGQESRMPSPSFARACPALCSNSWLRSKTGSRPRHSIGAARTSRNTDMTHVLDRPVWSALSTRHAALAEGGSRARRYPSAISPFAAACDDHRESLQALEELASSNESLLLIQADDIVVPAGLVTVSTAFGVQMIAERPLAKVTDERIERLSDADAADMLALATLTKPGPFSLKAQSLGEFWGVKAKGVLVAMAGERMKQVGFTELSGVCAHPDFRGNGLGRSLSL